MRFQPNDLPELELGEIRNVTFKLAAPIGTNSITDFEIASPNLTFGTPSIAGTNVTVLLHANTAGNHTIIATADLSSAETIKGFVRAKVVDSSQCNDSGDYR